VGDVGQRLPIGRVDCFERLRRGNNSAVDEVAETAAVAVEPFQGRRGRFRGWPPGHRFKYFSD
jgi:hypothetical protein